QRPCRRSDSEGIPDSQAVSRITPSRVLSPGDAQPSLGRRLCARRTRAGCAHSFIATEDRAEPSQSDIPPHRPGRGLQAASLVWSVWLIWFIWLVSFNQINTTNQINQTNETD